MKHILEISNLDPTKPNVYLVVAGMFVFLIFISKRNLLVSRRPFMIISVISIFFYAVSFLFEHVPDKGSKTWYWCLRMPLIQLLLYRLMYFIFKRLLKREPEDTSFDIKDVTPDQDKAFNIIYAIVAIIFPAFLRIIGAL